MIHKFNKVLAVILARGGSKGIPKKNIVKIDGHPLIAYTIQAAKESKFVSQIVVSTDSDEIRKIANSYGASTPFLRSKKLSGDKITSAEALRDAVLKSESFFKEVFDLIIELPCVAPFRDAKDIDQAIEIILKNNKLDSVIGYVHTGEKHPIRLKRIKKNRATNFCKDYKESNYHSRRQDFEPAYIRNGSIYCMRRSLIVKKGLREGRQSYPYIMSTEKSINIDEAFDLKIAKLMIQDGLCNNVPKLLPPKDEILKSKKKFKKILITAPTFFLNPQLNTLKKKYEIILIHPDNDNIKNIKKYCHEVSIWICNPCPKYIITNELIKKFTNLKIIATPSTGDSHIEKKYINRKNIKLLSLKNSGFEKKIYASSEYTFCMIMSLLRKMPTAISKVQSYKWRDVENDLRGEELRGKTLGIIGYGRIGSNIGKYANAMGLNIIFYDPYIKKGKFAKKINNHISLLKKSDIVAVCCHLNRETYKMVDKTWFVNMKKGSYFINSSRGDIVNEKDLIRFLKNKHINSAFLDVISNENILRKKLKKKKIILYGKENHNLYISPHIAGLTYQSETKAFKILCDLIKNEDN
jgi:D-3-phosphoglycerate dehydrogenase